MKKLIISVASVLVAGTILTTLMLPMATESKKNDNVITTVYTSQGTTSNQTPNESDMQVFTSKENKSNNTASTTKKATTNTTAITTTTTAASSATNSVSNETVSLAKAKEIALKDAGITASNVKFTKAKLDKEDGEYEIEFIAYSNDGDYEYEYEINSASGKIVKREFKSITVTTVPSSEKKMISLEIAKGVALSDAGLRLTDCTFTKAELDKDDGEYEYELDFNDGKKKYSYSINAYTSDITDKEVESIKQTTPKHDQDEKTQSTVSYSNNNQKATLSDIKKIALNDAKISEAKAEFTKTEYDKDDKEYEIEFISGSKKYEYEINEYGTILKKEIEKVKDSDYHTSALISIDKARSIALTHAGLKESEIKQKKIELERDDGIYKYEFEFTVGKYEYEYEINAKTGEIIDFEKEIDD